MRVLLHSKCKWVLFIGESTTDRYCVSRPAAQATVETCPLQLYKPSVMGSSLPQHLSPCVWVCCWVYSTIEALSSHGNSLILQSIFNPSVYSSVSLMSSETCLSYMSSTRLGQEHSCHANKENCRALAARRNVNHQIRNLKSWFMFPSLAKISYTVSMKPFII